jgi:hypothetical protein
MMHTDGASLPAVTLSGFTTNYSLVTDLQLSQSPAPPTSITRPQCQPAGWQHDYPALSMATCQVRYHPAASPSLPLQTSRRPAIACAALHLGVHSWQLWQLLHTCAAARMQARCRPPRHADHIHCMIQQPVPWHHGMTRRGTARVSPDHKPLHFTTSLPPHHTLHTQLSSTPWPTPSIQQPDSVHRSAGIARRQRGHPPDAYKQASAHTGSPQPSPGPKAGSALETLGGPKIQPAQILVPCTARGPSQARSSALKAP